MSSVPSAMVTVPAEIGPRRFNVPAWSTSNVVVENRVTIGSVNAPAPRFEKSMEVPCVLKTPP
jgi:hypothetical protein